MDLSTLLNEGLHIITTGIDLVGIGIVLWGTLVATVGFVRIKIGKFCGGDFVIESAHIRATLGTYVLLGLEFMIAADIINTFQRPSVQDVLTLAVIVVIRVAIRYSLGREIEAIAQASGKQK